MASNTIGNTTFTSNNGTYQVTVGNRTVTLNSSGGSYTATINGVTYGVSINSSGVPTFNIGAFSFTSNASGGYSVVGTAALGTGGTAANIQFDLDSNFNVSDVQVGATVSLGKNLGGNVEDQENFNTNTGAETSRTVQGSFSANIPGVGTVSGTYNENDTATSASGLGIGNPFNSTWSASYAIASNNGTTLSSGNSSGGMSLASNPDGSQVAFMGNTQLYLPNGNGNQGLILQQNTGSTGAPTWTISQTSIVSGQLAETPISTVYGSNGSPAINGSGQFVFGVGTGSAIYDPAAQSWSVAGQTITGSANGVALSINSTNNVVLQQTLYGDIQLGTATPVYGPNGLTEWVPSGSSSGLFIGSGDGVLIQNGGVVGQAQALLGGYSLFSFANGQAQQLAAPDGQGNVTLSTLTSLPTATIGDNTVTIVTPTAANENGVIPPPFAALQSNDASASSSNVLNVLGYPWEPTATAVARSHGWRHGFSWITPVGRRCGEVREDGRISLWGFDVVERRQSRFRHRRIVNRDRSSDHWNGHLAGASVLIGQAGHRIALRSMSISSSSVEPGRIRRLRATNDPEKMSCIHGRTTHGCGHDESIRSGGMG
jgi:hypothetical protein